MYSQFMIHGQKNIKLWTVRLHPTTHLPPVTQLHYKLSVCTPLHTSDHSLTCINISQDSYLLAGGRQGWDVSGYGSGCVVTVFYAVYHFCTSQLLSISVVLFTILTL